MPQSPAYYVYVLRNPSGQLYIGFTTDLDRRVQRHQTDRGGWTRGRGPWELVHHETFADAGSARRRERELKSGRANERLRERFAHDP